MGTTLGLYPNPEEEEEDAETVVRDIRGDANTLKWAGISLGKETTFNLKLAMQRVANSNAEDNSISKLQFWGKILGTKADYIILQGELDAPFEAPETPEGADATLTMEGGDGGNKYTYWVANSVYDKFTQLPNVTPQQIIAARRLKRMFTGNLDTVVGGHPPFPGGTEAGLLRAVIALITTQTHVIPKDILMADEEDVWAIAENEDEEEFVPPTAAQPQNGESDVQVSVGACAQQSGTVPWVSQREATTSTCTLVTEFAAPIPIIPTAHRSPGPSPPKRATPKSRRPQMCMKHLYLQQRRRARRKRKRKIK